MKKEEENVSKEQVISLAMKSDNEEIRTVGTHAHCLLVDDLIDIQFNGELTRINVQDKELIDKIKSLCLEHYNVKLDNFKKTIK